MTLKLLPSVLNASEFSLTIALVVFVMLTIFLLAVIVLIAVSKGFRAFLFREHRSDDKATKLEVEPEPVQEEANAAPTEQEAPKKPAKRRKKANDPFGIPTVPLTLVAPESAPAKRTRKSDDMPAAIAAQSDKSTYTVRSVPKSGGKKRSNNS